MCYFYVLSFDGDAGKLTSAILFLFQDCSVSAIARSCLFPVLFMLDSYIFSVDLIFLLVFVKVIIMVFIC